MDETKIILEEIEARLRKLKDLLVPKVQNYAPTPFYLEVKTIGLDSVLEELILSSDPNTQAFLESLRVGLEKYKKLTDKQMAAVEKIWNNKR